jgi:hypothetical protein
MTRWVKVDPSPRRTRAKPKAADSSRIDSYRQILNPQPPQSAASRWLRKGGLLVAAGYLARWGWQIAAQNRRPPESPGDD